MKTSWLVTLFGLCLFTFMLITAPFSLAAPVLPEARLSGSIWHGQATDIPTPLGPAQLDFNASLLSAFGLRLGGSWRLEGLGLEAHGMSSTGLSGDVRLEDMRATISVSALRLPRPLVGDVTLALDELVFDKSGRCDAGTGFLSSDALERSESTLNWRGPALEGPIECADGNLVARLAGENTDAAVAFTLTLFPDGRYESTASVRTENPILVVALAYEGFDNRGNSLIKTYQGRWQS